MNGPVHWVLRLGEVGLKSKPVRRMFQRSMKRSIAASSKRWEIPLRPSFGREQIIVRSDAPVEDVEEALCHQLGIVAIDRVRHLGEAGPLGPMAKHIVDAEGQRGVARTFGVKCRRVGQVEGWTSPAYAAALGAALVAEDPSLSVDLSNPDWWVHVHLRKTGVDLVERRLTGPGGLPAGAQGDVLVRLENERDLAAAFLIMRRGCRLLPLQHSDAALVERLRRWDQNIGHRSMHHTHDGQVRERPSWGMIGLSVDASDPRVGRTESEVKTTPLASLDPLMGWTEGEVSNLLKHIDAPWRFPPDPDGRSWLSDEAWTGVVA